MTENTEFDFPSVRLSPETKQAVLTSPVRTTRVQNWRRNNKERKGKTTGEATTRGKRAEEDVRKEQLEKHAILLHVTPIVPRTFTAAETKEQQEYNQLLQKWRKIERYGFQVSRDAPGCWIPHQQYLQNSGGREEYAPHVAAQLWNGMTKPAVFETTDVDGWPIEPQYSHLCHLSMCCNPAHIVLEAQWKNIRRNYCGKQGPCDCGMQPQCLRKYFPSNVERELNLLSYDSQRLGERVRATCSTVNVSIEAADKYRVQDQQRRNRTQRKKKSEKHEKQRQQNEKHTGKRKLESVV